MRIIILCFLLLIPTVVAAEDKGIFYILDEKFINNISELPYTHGIPTINQHKIQNIQGWINIVGWRNLSRENGNWYIRGNPASMAIIQYSAEGKVSGYIDSIDKKLSLSESRNYLIARLNVILRWHITNCDQNSCWNNNFQENAVFQDVQMIPEQYPSASVLHVNLTQYNNSVYENIGISITNISGLNKYTIRYGNSTATYQMKIAHMEQLPNGLYFANVTQMTFLEMNGSMSRYGNIILLNGNISRMNLSDLKITGSNIYETSDTNSSNFNINRIEFAPEKEFDNLVMIWFLGIMASMSWGILYLIRRLRLQWI